MGSAAQLEKAQTFIKYVNVYDYDAVAPLLSPDFVYRVLPRSLHGTLQAEFIKLLQDLPAMITQLNFQPLLDVIQGHDVVVIHVYGKLSSGGEYKNEYVFMIRFRREEICKVKEFMDSKYLSGIFGEQN
ncbi:hypothetical protein B0H10DRAFT_1939799 [Mycena sp. CBHHK59/15]|nr:hypothetical protein B0H10DRAFT_1939799 [Mycena sp. CBHHK59/15]